MSSKSDFTSFSDIGLDHAKELVARILNFIVSDEARLRRFLQLTGFKPETLRDAAQSPLFMLSALDAVAKDPQLLRMLGDQEQITPDMIESIRARLAFQVTVEVTGEGADSHRPGVVKERVEHQLRGLLKMLRRQSGGGRSA